MPSNNTPSNDTDNIEITTRNNQKYATDHTTGTGCYGSTRAEALFNLAAKLQRKTHRDPADQNTVDELLNTE